ncbi:MAG: class D beta-lactamase [Deltaproteobacteria bacterium]|nr:class D beta-lactamase [Deltaproteobacteria bacterium]
MHKVLLLILSIVSLSSAHAEDTDLAALFDKEGLNGTIVIASLDGSREFIHNDARANTRLAVASTFKIFNSLIALEEGVVTKDEVLLWDGTMYEAFPDWNRNHTLASAFKASCVWCYQELARRVGAQKYPPYIKQAAYGVLREPFEGTTFWLDGSLTISAKEQIEFLRKVIGRSLPFKPSTYETLREIMVMEKTPEYTIRAKTGWAVRVSPQVGWYVGYVEAANNEVWVFATNIEMRSEKDLPLRQQLTKASLQVKGIIK